MKIDLTEVHKRLEAIRAERRITAENQKISYIVDVIN